MTQLDGLTLDARSDRRLDVWCTYCGHFVIESVKSGVELRKLLDVVVDHDCAGEEQT